MVALPSCPQKKTLGGQSKAAIRGHLKTGHREKP